MPEDTYRSQFRLPYDLYEKLKEEAAKNHRSLNAEIVARLEQSVHEEEMEKDPYAVRIPDIPDISEFIEMRKALKDAIDKLNEIIKSERD